MLATHACSSPLFLPYLPPLLPIHTPLFALASPSCIPRGLTSGGGPWCLNTACPWAPKGPVSPGLLEKVAQRGRLAHSESSIFGGPRQACPPHPCLCVEDAPSHYSKCLLKTRCALSDLIKWTTEAQSKISCTQPRLRKHSPSIQWKEASGIPLAISTPLRPRRDSWNFFTPSPLS